MSSHKKIVIIWSYITLFLFFSPLTHAPHDHKFHGDSEDHSPFEHCAVCVQLHVLVDNHFLPELPRITELVVIYFDFLYKYIPTVDLNLKIFIRAPPLIS